MNEFTVRLVAKMGIDYPGIEHVLTDTQRTVLGRSTSIARLAGLKSWSGGNSNIDGAHYTGMNAVVELFCRPWRIDSMT